MRSPKRRILYCEDDPESRELIRYLFTRKDYDIVCADNGTATLHLARREQFDLVLLDNWLPDLSGEEITRHIREFDQTTPILFYSAAAYEADKQAALNAGAQAYITKPPDLDVLLQEVERLITQTNPATPINENLAGAIR